MAVPIIDLGTAENSSKQLDALDHACRDHGFFLLMNHGMDKVIEEMWEVSAAFFSQSKKDKRRVYRSEDNPLGYFDKELTKRKRDLKEVYDFMEPRTDSKDFNQWPQDQNKFREISTRFFRSASEVAKKTLDLLYLGYLKGSFNGSALPVGDRKTSTVRYNFYPMSDPLDPGEIEANPHLGNLALNHHTDPGILTLLVQDMVGGLQTLSKSRGWIDVPPSKDTIVVNLGDSLQVWTNDNYRAAIHRVLPMGGSARYSTPYFFNPSRDALLEPLQSFSNTPALYRSFTWKEYIRGRVEDNFSDLDEDDIQIAKYRVEP